ncbi:hypothetical protein D3C84_1240540 [compost metagenome]
MLRSLVSGVGKPTKRRISQAPIRLCSEVPSAMPMAISSPLRLSCSKRLKAMLRLSRVEPRNTPASIG